MEEMAELPGRIGRGHLLLGGAVAAGAGARDRERDRAVRELAESVGRRGLAVAFDLLRDAAEAEDAVQEALARTCARYHEVRDPDRLGAWFHRVLVNLCMRSLRRRRLMVRLGLRRDRAAGDDDAPEPADPPSPAPPADQDLARAAAARRLCREVDRLPPRQKAAVVLHYGHDCSIAETAEALGIGAESVKTHLRRAMATLRARLEEP